jgi:acetyltransferase-like isoleucine patch superfamily enzyme
MSRIKIEIFTWLESILSWVPGLLGYILRYQIHSIFLGKCGKSFKLGVFARIQQPQAVFVEDNVGINDRAWLAANSRNGEIYIGKDTIIGPNVVLHTGNHVFNRRDLPIRKQGHSFAPIHIGEDVWIAANVTILKGVKVGNGAVIAAGSVVTKDVEPMCIVAGVPAIKVGDR